MIKEETHSYSAVHLLADVCLILIIIDATTLLKIIQKCELFTHYQEEKTLIRANYLAKDTI